jgi:hypothetical protein
MIGKMVGRAVLCAPRPIQGGRASARALISADAPECLGSRGRSPSQHAGRSGLSAREQGSPGGIPPPCPRDPRAKVPARREKTALDSRLAEDCEPCLTGNLLWQWLYFLLRSRRRRCERCCQGILPRSARPAMRSRATRRTPRCVDPQTRSCLALGCFKTPSDRRVPKTRTDQKAS